jgi:hypothetical protein
VYFLYRTCTLPLLTTIKCREGSASLYHAHEVTYLPRLTTRQQCASIYTSVDVGPTHASLLTRLGRKAQDFRAEGLTLLPPSGWCPMRRARRGSLWRPASFLRVFFVFYDIRGVCLQSRQWGRGVLHTNVADTCRQSPHCTVSSSWD